ncbi:Uncharacterised protein [Mycobacteroides abscessus subsp. abscessus]|nr:Uncharacterised protein [Mycobacteroides abscessus subsp. abscessus]
MPDGIAGSDLKLVGPDLQLVQVLAQIGTLIRGGHEYVETEGQLPHGLAILLQLCDGAVSGGQQAESARRAHSTRQGGDGDATCHRGTNHWKTKPGKHGTHATQRIDAMSFPPGWVGMPNTSPQARTCSNVP